jgi:hypothetical protein
MLSGKSIPQAQSEPVSSLKKILVILAHAFIGWALCAATMGIGMAVTTELKAMIIHAIGAPVFFASISLVYFRRYHYTSPLATALIFVGFVILVDFFLVAMVIMKSFDMFTSPLGTWIPFTLIFLTTYLTGRQVTKSKTSR